MFKKILLVSFLVLMLVACETKKDKAVEVINGKAFNSIFYKILIGQNIADETKSHIIPDIAKKLDHIDKVFSNWNENSEITKFNQLKNNEWFYPTEDLWFLLLKSNEMNQFTEGYFDITLGNSIDYYGFGDKEAKNVGSIGFANLVFDIEKRRIKKIKSIKLNMSAIVEGFALDEIKKMMLANNINNFLIELGGEILANGKKFGEDWVVALEKPNIEKKEMQEVIKIKPNAMIIDTSGGYKNYKESNTHILNPKLGKPTTNKSFSVSVIASNATDADALATALVAMGEELAIKFAEKNDLAVYINYFDKTSNRYTVFVTKKWIKSLEL